MKKNIKVNYLDLIKDSIKFTWRHKILWIFGFILAFFSSNAGGGFNGWTSSGEDFDETKVEDTAERFREILSSPLFWAAIFSIFVLCIMICVLIWYLKSVAKVSILDAVRLEIKKKKLKFGFKSLWSNSHSRLFRVFKYDLFWAVITFPLMLALILFIVGLVFSFNFVGIFCAVCFLVPVILVLSIAVSILRNVGFRVLLLKDLSIFGTLKFSYNLVYKNLGQVILGLIVLNVPLAFVGFALGVFSLVVFMPLIFMLLVTILISPFVFIALLIIVIIVGLIIGLALALINAPLKVYYESYMTRFVLCFLEEKDIVEGEIADCC